MIEKSEKKNLSAMDEYINKVFKLVLLLVPGACECAGLAYTFSKIVGWLPTVSWLALIIFDITCLIYLAIGMYFIKTGIKDGCVIDNKLKQGKIFITVIMFIQFNFIVWMIPAKDFWGFAFFFVVLTVFFLDYKMVAITSIVIAGSVIMSWILNGKVHLPAKDGTFMVNMLDRVVCIVLSLATLVLLTYMINYFLENEVERNTKKIRSMLTAVSELSESIHDAGKALSKISENGSVSAKELATISEQLVENSNQLSACTEESMTNLTELREWEKVVANDVEKVEITSKDLLDKSKENEKLLNDLHTINGEVSETMEVTTDVTHRLSEAVQEIGITLKLINDISTSINLLALNASIEAARAGDAGRGFSVVAAEVGNLANNTQESLKVIEPMIERVQQNVREINKQVEENTAKLGTQNEYFAKVFQSMQDMTEILNVTVNAIGAMNTTHSKQGEVIKKTVQINQDIAERIQSENEQFGIINVMAENNASDTIVIANQANAINAMVDKMSGLLNEN